ncbi:hypothetical protein WDU94_003132 [Cyamophila willieti]
MDSALPLIVPFIFTIVTASLPGQYNQVGFLPQPQQLAQYYPSPTQGIQALQNMIPNPYQAAQMMQPQTAQQMMEHQQQQIHAAAMALQQAQATQQMPTAIALQQAQAAQQMHAAMAQHQANLMQQAQAAQQMYGMAGYPSSANYAPQVSPYGFNGPYINQMAYGYQNAHQIPFNGNPNMPIMGGSYPPQPSTIIPGSQPNGVPTLGGKEVNVPKLVVAAVSNEIKRKRDKAIDKMWNENQDEIENNQVREKAMEQMAKITTKAIKKLVDPEYVDPKKTATGNMDLVKKN